jgi:flagellar biosynthetic protein FlhB
MADADAAERTEQATPKRREEARRHGQVVLSPEVAPVVVLATILLVATAGAPLLLHQGELVLRAWLAAVGPTAAHDDASLPLILHALREIGAVVAPLLLAIGVAGTGAVVAQVGFHPNVELLVPDPSRLAGGPKRIVSLQSLANLVKSLLKIVVVGAVAWRVVVGLSQAAIAAPAMSPAEILALAATGLRRLVLWMALPLAVLGAADWWWQRWRFEQSIKMSRQEIKQEHKESEGDPQIRGRFRRLHRELAKRRMLADVKRADVVLTNPTHVAVALRYRPDEGGAPRVLAKGADELAQKIKDAARGAGVPIVERRALARALFRQAQIGQEIPSTLYKAVAEILAYIYSLRGFPVGAER